jgi:GT2 family glycosyltransferase
MSNAVPDTVVFIPAWNEEDSLPEVLDELRAGLPSVDVLLVDDGSTDRNAEIAAERRPGPLVRNTGFRAPMPNTATRAIRTMQPSGLPGPLAP